MPLIVQKFGGTSVADAYRIHLAARRAIRAKLDGNQVVLVISAMGDTTDRLVELAGQVTRRPSKRELDMLLSAGEQISIALVAMAVHEAGYEAISMTGLQVGLLTDSAHTRARIRSIDTRRIREPLDQGKIVIVAGFQGVDEDRNVTTLGRGGSDTTALALAAALHADLCEIYTDVDGVHTADPRLVPQARKIDALSYDEMLELAALGAGVMHARAIEFGKNYDVPIRVRSSFSDNPGTLIMSQPPDLESIVVRGAALQRDVARITFVDLPQRPGVAAEIFGEFADRRIVVGDIGQTVASQGSRVNIAFTLDATGLSEARAVAELLAGRLDVPELHVDDRLARVSVVGVGLRSHSGVAAKLFDALAAEKITIEGISSSDIVLSVLVRQADAERALQAVHAAFELDRPA